MALTSRLAAVIPFSATDPTLPTTLPLTFPTTFPPTLPTTEPTDPVTLAVLPVTLPCTLATPSPKDPAITWPALNSSQTASAITAAEGEAAAALFRASPVEPTLRCPANASSQV